MATDGYASWINGPEFGGLDLRRADSVLQMAGPISAPFSVRSGRRVNGSGLTVSVGGSPEAWTVSPGPATVADPAYATQGAWRISIPNAVSANLPARPGAGQSRIDVIIARIYDPVAIGSGTAEVKIERLNGGAATTPSAPTPPVGSITFELGRLLVPASGPIVVTQSTRRTVAAGGVLPVATTEERNKLKDDGIAYQGLVVDNAQTGSLERYSGTDWKVLADVSDTGWVDISVAAGWTASSPAPQVRRLNGVTYARGLVRRTSAVSVTNTPIAVCSLPAGMGAGTTHYYPAGSIGGIVEISVSGTSVTVRSLGGAIAIGNTGHLALDTLNFAD